MATGALFPFECAARLCDEFATRDGATPDFEHETLTRWRDGRVFPLNLLGDVRPVIEAGGIFPYARASDMIATAKG